LVRRRWVFGLHVRLHGGFVNLPDFVLMSFWRTALSPAPIGRFRTGETDIHAAHFRETAGIAAIVTPLP
jgi:hypothetical protein